MNRRSALKKVVALGGAAVVAQPLIAKVVEARTLYGYSGEGSCAPILGPTCEAPKPDLRTPEQIVEDSDRAFTDGILHDTHSEWNQSHKFHYSLNGLQFGRLHARLIEQGTSFTVHEKGWLIINGNVISIY